MWTVWAVVDDVSQACSLTPLSTPSTTVHTVHSPMEVDRAPWHVSPYAGY